MLAHFVRRGICPDWPRPRAATETVLQCVDQHCKQQDTVTCFISVIPFYIGFCKQLNVNKRLSKLYVSARFLLLENISR